MHCHIYLHESFIHIWWLEGRRMVWMAVSSSELLKRCRNAALFVTLILLEFEWCFLWKLKLNQYFFHLFLFDMSCTLTVKSWLDLEHNKHLILLFFPCSGWSDNIISVLSVLSGVLAVSYSLSCFLNLWYICFNINELKGHEHSLTFPSIPAV